jgi:hypothetical protein
MPRDQTRGKIDLSLPIESVEQSGTDLLRIGGQVPRKAAASSAISNNFARSSAIAQRQAALKKIASFRPEP